MDQLPPCPNAKTQKQDQYIWYERESNITIYKVHLKNKQKKEYTIERVMTERNNTQYIKTKKCTD